MMKCRTTSKVSTTVLLFSLVYRVAIDSWVHYLTSEAVLKGFQFRRWKYVCQCAAPSGWNWSNNLYQMELRAERGDLKSILDVIFNSPKCCHEYFCLLVFMCGWLKKTCWNASGLYVICGKLMANTWVLLLPHVLLCIRGESIFILWLFVWSSVSFICVISFVLLFYLIKLMLCQFYWLDLFTGFIYFIYIVFSLFLVYRWLLLLELNIYTFLLMISCPAFWKLAL